MRLATMITIGSLVGSAQIPCRYEGTAIIQSPDFSPSGQRTAFNEFLDIRVDGDNGSINPPGQGDAWGEGAFKFLQDALALARANATEDSPYRIWVAATDPINPYRPDRDVDNPLGTEDRDATFLLDFNDVWVLGGFNGTETGAVDRNPAVNITVLSGEVNMLGACGDPDAGDCLANNGTPGCMDATCCEIVCAVRPQCCTDQWGQSCANLANLVCGICGEPDSGSCFQANDTPGCEDGDCCALVCDVDPICCIFPWDQTCADIAIDICQGVSAKAYHVVTANGVDDSVRIDGFTITDGLADGPGNNDRGAGMLILNASPTVVRVTFTENSAPLHGGGAMYIQGTAHPRVVNCSMIANVGRFGGAIRIELSPASATLVNCLISGNTAIKSGGGILAKSSVPGTMDLINCTVTDNAAQFSGGGIYCAGSIVVTVTNSILWGNVPDQIDGVATVTYSDVEGEWPGEGNIDADPLFVDPDNDGFRLSPGSPSIDAGNNWGVPIDANDYDEDGVLCELFPVDLDGNPRFNADEADIDPGCGIPVVVDMGAYEYQFDPADQVTFADLNVDGAVGVADLLQLLASWGPCGKGCCLADLDIDGTVGLSDLLALLANWGPCP